MGHIPHAPLPSDTSLRPCELSSPPAAVLHLEGRTEEAGRRYGCVPGRPAAVYGGLLSLLRAGRALPPARRRAETLTDALRRCRSVGCLRSDFTVCTQDGSSHFGTKKCKRIIE